MQTNKTPGVNSPKAWIAVYSNRQKIYGKNGDLVYLDDEQEFQIELYNPTQEKYLAKIYLNDKLISNTGLVLKPGQRYFLDRYLDEKKKFLFSVYSVDSSEEVKEAIKNNGKVRVEFFQEMPILNNFTLGVYSGTTITYPSNPTYVPTWNGNTIWAGTTSPTYVGTCTTYDSGNSIFTTTNLSGDINFSSSTLTSGSCAYYNSPVAGSIDNMKSLETGMVEKGSESEQNFGNDNGTYSIYKSYSSEYQILPRSTKPVEVTEIRSYCPGCGTRNKKKTWKFCPNCGESLD